MKRRTLKIASPALVVAVLGIVLWVNAGDLTPPPGPVGPTGRFGPRIEVDAIHTPGDADSLFRIAQGGSYYLTDNITGVAGKHGIEIAADDVTLDLNGFALVGAPGSIDGISVLAGVEKLTVRNGVIRDWGGYGVGPQDHVNAPANGLYEDLAISGNGDHGLFAGDNSRVLDCSSSNNGGGGDGFQVGSGSSLQNCVAQGNSGSVYADGIDVQSGCTLTNCAASSNAASGIHVVGGKCVITGCTANSNTGSGIRAEGANSISSCTTDGNGGDGISFWPGSSVVGCTAHSNGVNGFGGTAFGHGSSLVNCTASENGTVDPANGDGFDAGIGCTLTNCSANSNPANGIRAVDKSGLTITSCTTHSNGLHGINAGDGCTVAGCTSYGNGGFGIHATNSLIRGNTVVNNTAGGCDTPGCTLVENHGCP